MNKTYINSIYGCTNVLNKPARVIGGLTVANRKNRTRLLLKTIKTLGVPVIYCDTDSVKQQKGGET